MKVITYIALFPILTAAALSDLKDGKIPNRLIGCGLVLFLTGKAILLFPAFSGQNVNITGILYSGVKQSAGGLFLSAACSIVLLLFWRLGLLGGGDVKLFWLLFLFLPGYPGVFCFAVTFIAAVPAALYGLFTGVRRVRLGGAILLSAFICATMEVWML